MSDLISTAESLGLHAPNRISIKFNTAPVAWQRPRFGRNGGFTHPKVRAFERELQMQAIEAWKYDPITGPLSAVIVFFLKRPQKPDFHVPAVRPDVDNFCKGVLDSVNGILWIDDAQIVQLTLSKKYCDEINKSPCIYLSVEKLTR